MFNLKNNLEHLRIHENQLLPVNQSQSIDYVEMTEKEYDLYSPEPELPEVTQTDEYLFIPSYSYEGRSLENIEPIDSPEPSDGSLSSDGSTNQSFDQDMNFSPLTQPTLSTQNQEENPRVIAQDPRIFKYLVQELPCSEKRSKMKNDENLLKEEFKHEKKPYPKIEDVRLCLMRLVRRMIKKIKQASQEKLKPELKEGNEKQVKSYLIMEEIYYKYPDELEAFSCTKNGPQTEGKITKKNSTVFKNSKLKKTQSLTNLPTATSSAEINRTISITYTSSLRDFKTFNNECIKILFHNKYFRGFYKAFIDYLFEASKEEIMKILKIKCCKQQVCTCCSNKWEELKEFCLTTLVLCNLNICS